MFSRRIGHPQMLSSIWNANLPVIPNRWVRLACLVSTLFAAAAKRSDAEDWVTLYAAARADAQRVSTSSLAEPLGPQPWKETLERRRERWREMLGLSPLPERTPLEATVTGMLDRGDYVVEKVHFQSVPGGYVVGNLYRPAKVEGRLPAVVYLCGHTKGKVNAPYQANPRWFGTHGYVCLVLDPIQLGEAQGYHHGTSRGDRWDWQSRGYTPLGTEVWNAMRALDYLESRADVDPERMGATGLSGGGVVSWSLAAADTRVRAVAPVCQTGSVHQVVADRGVEGHCDCAFWINYDRWCWPDLGALIAPRALMIASGSEDVLWRPSGYRPVADRIARQYAALGVADHFSLVEDLSPHGYTPKIRKSVFGWFNRHLRGDGSEVTDDVTDFVEPEENLLVFGGELPESDAMREIDESLVARRERPEFDDPSRWREHQLESLRRLRSTTFRYTVSAAEGARPGEVRGDGRDTSDGSYSTEAFTHPDGLTLTVKTRRPVIVNEPRPTLVFAMPPEATRAFTGGSSSRPRVGAGVITAAVEVRNTGVTSVGPGYLWNIRRTYPMLGHTLAERQVSDLLAGVATVLRRGETGPVAVYGRGPTAPLALYAALLDPGIDEVVLQDCPTTHEDPHTPTFLGVLRVGDLADNLALLHPKKVTFVGEIPDAFEPAREIYRRLGDEARFRSVRQIGDWPVVE